MGSIDGSTQKLVWWILGTLLVISLGLSSALFGMIKSDIDRIERRQSAMEKKIDQIQREYYRIAVVEAQLEELLRLSR